MASPDPCRADHILLTLARTRHPRGGQRHGAPRPPLNVLANIAGKSYAQIFDEFEGNHMPNSVQIRRRQYHLGTWGVYSDDGLATMSTCIANPRTWRPLLSCPEGIVRAGAPGRPGPASS